MTSRSRRSRLTCAIAGVTLRPQCLPPGSRNYAPGWRPARTENLQLGWNNGLLRSLSGSRRELWLAGKHDVVRIAEHEHLGCAPNDPLQVYHGAHAQSKLPQQQVLYEVQGEAPRPERQLAVADGIEAQTAQLEDEQIGAKKVVTPIFEKRGDAAIIMLSTTGIQRSGRTNEQPPSRLE